MIKLLLVLNFLFCTQAFAKKSDYDFIQIKSQRYRVKKPLANFYKSLDKLMADAQEKEWLSEKGIPNNSLKLITTGEELKAERILAIRSAQNSIYISTYAFKYDVVGKEIISELCEKSKEGLDVRLIIDNHGGNKLKKKIIKKIRKECDIAIMKFNPPSWSILKIPYIMHEKLMIIDGNTVLMGGNGISSQYHIFSRESEKWQDLDIKVEGQAACNFHETFKQTWKNSVSIDKRVKLRRAKSAREKGHVIKKITNPSYLRLLYGKRQMSDCITKEVFGKSTTLPVHNNPFFSKERKLFSAYKEAILRTKESIKLYAPYFVPHDEYIALLLWARSKGVKVQVITNSLLSNDEGSEVLTAMAYKIPMLLSSGVEILLWNKKSTMHRKAGIFDDKYAYVGSDNLDERGHNWSSESILFTNDENLISQMHNEFSLDSMHTLKMDFQELRKLRSIPGKIKQWFIRKLIKFF